MLIYRRQDRDLATAAQSAVLSDDRLSLTAVAVLLKILDHAPEWNVNAQSFHEMCEEARPGGESKRSIRMAFRELTDAGYMRRTKGRRPNGDFHTTIEATDIPDDFSTVGCSRDHGVLPVGGDSVVYVVGPTEGATVKIGTTRDIEKRVSGIQNGNPALMVVHWTCPGSVELESYLHRAFQARRRRGEWFDFGEDDPVVQVASAAERFYELPLGALNTSPVRP